MASKRSLGFIENEWTCPNCGSRNKGSLKACENCGAPQPENVKFELPSEQKMVTEKEKVKTAQAGADIHCGFCGTRNPATAETCSQCGANLKEGKAREAGQIMQAPAPQPKVVKCASCGAENPGSNTTCSNCGAALQKAQTAQAAAPTPATSAVKPAAKKKISPVLIGAVLGFLALCCIGVYFIFGRTSSTVKGTVTSVHWQTNVPVEEVQAVDYSNKKGNPPSDAYNVSCHDESHDVCATQIVDKGNGYSEVTENCQTETETYCSYTMDEWQIIQTYSLEGDNLQPIYESPSISNDQRIGEQTEELTVNFSTDKGNKTYSPDTISTYQQFTPGSTWTLKLNLLGGVLRVEP